MAPMDDKGKDHLLSRDEKFLRKLKEIVESNLENEQFGVENLAEAMAMSRIQLYRKIHRLIGKNVSQYIREVRLERAMKLLQQDVASVAEIAYQVGFRSPTYFNKCFHDFYGYPPGEIIKKHLAEQRSVEEIENQKIRRKEKRIMANLYFLYPFYVLLFVVLIISVSFYFIKLMRIATSPASAKEKTIAVLPFRNESPEPDNDFLCNAMHDDIQTHLQKISDLSVRSGQSVEQYRKTVKDIPTIAKELNVAYIIDSSVSHFRDSVHLRVKLIDAKKDVQIWAESFTLPYNLEVIKVQTFITKRIVNSLGAILSPDEMKRIIPKYTNNIKSYNYSIKGEQEMDNFIRYWDRKHRESALSLFNQALKIDPENIRALVGKGNVYLYIGEPDSVIHYCDKAILIDPEFSGSYNVKASYYNYIKKYDLAIKDYLKTIELAPNDAMAHNKLGQIYFDKNKDVIKGLTYLKKSLELNVDSQPDVFYWLGMCYMRIGDYEMAKDNYLKMIELGLDGLGIEQYSWCLTLQRKHKEAFIFLDTICHLQDQERLYYREYWYHSLMEKDFIRAEKYYQEFKEKGYELHAKWKVALADMYIQMGRDKDAHLILEKSRTFYENHLKNFGENWYNTFNLSQIYAMMGENEKGLMYLSRAVDIGILWGWQDILEINTVYRNLWDEPQFKALVLRAKEERSALRAQVRAMEEEGRL